MEYTGNSVPAPGLSKNNPFTTDDELLFSAVGYTQGGAPLKPGQGVLLLGTLLKREESSKLYVKATGNDAEGVLRKTTDTGTDPNGQAWFGNIVRIGLLKLGKVKAANSGVNLSNVLGARIDEASGIFKF